MKKFQKLLCFVLAVFMMLGMNLTVFAHENQMDID